MENYGKTLPLKLLHDMFFEIAEKHYNYRDSWEILIEVLGHYLGIVQNPWLYSDPRRDVEVVEDRTSPLKRSAFQIEWPTFDLLGFLLGLQPKNAKPRIKYREPTDPHYTIYYDKRLTPSMKRYPHRHSSWGWRRDDVDTFLRRFTEDGRLESYVKNARAEAEAGQGTPNICAGVDHLGAIFEEFELAGRKNRLGQMLTPTNIVDFMIKILDYTKPSNKVETINDPATGTGRFMIEMSRLNPYKPMILTGIEIDLTLYRAALVNMAIYSRHPYVILCANTLAIRTDAGDIWKLGNLWDPPDMTPIYYKAKPPLPPFSLEAFIRAQKQEQETELE